MKIKQLLESSEHSTKEFTERFGDLELFHGSEEQLPDFVPYKKRGGSKDTFTPIHYLIDELGYKKFGIHIRSGMFLTRHLKTAFNYGSPQHLIPCDGFRIFVSTRFSDMTIDLSLTHVQVKNQLVRLIKEELNEEYGSDIILPIASKIIFKLASEDFNYLKNSLPNLIVDKFNDSGNGIIGEESAQNITNNFISLYTEKAQEYVDSIKEIKSEEEIREINPKIELMVYSPNGFVRIRG